MNDNRVDVLLLAPHRHLGEQKQKGEVINVSVAQSAWLIMRGVAKLASFVKHEKEVKG